VLTSTVNFQFDVFAKVRCTQFLSYAELEEQGELDRQRAERLAAKLRELNIDPDSI
jgi:hypothetical protein